MKKPSAAKGAAARVQTQERVSMPRRGFSRKYSPTATRTAKTEKMNCRMDSPKNTDSVKSRISGLIVNSIRSIWFLLLLQPHLTHNPVGHLDAAHQDEHVEDQLADVAPDHRGRGGVRIHCGRRRCEDGEDGAGQHDDRPLHTHPSIALEEALADVLCGLSGEGGQGDRRDGGVHVQLKEAPVDAQDHDEGEHPDEQPADEGDGPERDAGKEVGALDGGDDLLREHGLRGGTHARRAKNRADDALYDAQERQHELHAVGDRRLGQSEADEQLEGVLRLLELGEAAAGAHDAHDKKQDQQRVADGLHGAVDALHHTPDRPAPELLGGLGDQRPDLRQLPVPDAQGVLKILYDPVVGHGLTPRSG